MRSLAIPSRPPIGLPSRGPPPVSSCQGPPPRPGRWYFTDPSGPGEFLRQRSPSLIRRRSVTQGRSCWFRPLGTALLEHDCPYAKRLALVSSPVSLGEPPTYHSDSGGGSPLKLPPRPGQPRCVGPYEDLAVLPVPIPRCASRNLAMMAFANSSLQQYGAARLVNPERVRCRLDASEHRTFGHSTKASERGPMGRRVGPFGPLGIAVG